MTARGARARRPVAHEFAPAQPVKRRSTVTPVPWVVCSHCGLILLKNAVSAAAARTACPGLLDPEATS